MAGLAPTFGSSLNSGASIPIGGSMYMTDRGPLVTFDDKTEWLRQGSAVKYTGKYSKANKFPQLRTYGGTNNTLFTPGASTNFSCMSNGRAVATNYSGTIVIANSTLAGNAGAQNHFYRSTNGGSSWSAVSATVTSGHYINAIVWAGNRFVAAAATSTVSGVSFYHSTDGSSWTAGSTRTTLTNTPGVTLCADTVTGNVHAFSGTNSSHSVQICTTGSTFANPTAGVSANPTSNLQYIAGNNNKILAASGPSTGYYYSTNNGANYTSYTPASIVPTSSGFVAYVNGNFLLYNGTTLYVSSTPETVGSWRLSSFPSGVTVATAVSGFYNSDKSKYYLPIVGGFIYTSDGFNWTRCSIYDELQRGSGTIYYLPIDSNAGAPIISSYAAGAFNLEYLFSSSLGTPQYIGHNIPPVDANYEYIRIY